MIELIREKFVKPDVSLIRTPYFYFQYPQEPRKLEMLADLIIKYQEIIADLRYYESYSTFSQRERMLFNELGIKVAKLEIDTNYINYKDIQNNELMTLFTREYQEKIEVWDDDYLQGLLVAGVGVDPFDPDIYIFYKDDGTWSYGTYLNLVSSDEVRVRLFTSSIEYREGKREDVRNIEHLLYSCYDYGSERDSFTYFKRGLDSSQQVSLITAYKLNVLVGAVTAWRTRFHPNCTYFSMAALPFVQNENIYKVFLQRIQNAHDVKFPLQTSLWETSHGMKEFLEKNGFRLIRKTVTPLIDISNVAPVDQFLLDLQLNRHQYSVMTLREAYTNHDLIDQFIALVKATYEKTHTANPPGVHDHEEWEKLVFSNDTLLDGSFIAIKDNEVVAFALLHHPTREHKLELGWRGAKFKEDASQLVILLTNYQIKYARKNRFFRLEAEIDDTDEYAMKMLKYFPFVPAPAWLTYQKG